MPRYIVDASVAAKWYFQEEHTELAEILFEEGHHLLAPDFLHVEVAAIVWKRIRKAEVELVAAGEILTELAQIPIDLESAPVLVPDALSLALRTGRTIYDCLYLALAVREGCPLVTADRRFYNSLQSGPLSQHLLWIGDLIY